MVHFINCSGEQDITQHPEEIAPFHTEINEEEINFVKKSWSAAFFMEEGVSLLQCDLIVLI